MPALAAALALGLLGGCASTQPEEVPPDEQFGHRYGAPPDAREVVALAPPDSGQAYFYYDAPIDEVVVRHAAFEPGVPAEGQRVSVEVLVKGALPDACFELHDVEQERAGNLVEAQLEIRRPQGAVCARVVRPYRFYVLLTGLYGVGDYTLKLNGAAHPFEVRAPEEL